MKRFLPIIMAAFVIGASQPATAQPSNGVNCAALKDSPFMCVANLSNFHVMAIMASPRAQFGTDWISIPGGPIPPNGTSIVKFGAWSGCVQFVQIRTSDGQTHTWPNVNVCSASKFNVTGW